VEASLPRLKDLPALIVWGEKDFAFEDKERARFEQVFPLHKTEVLPAASHFLQEDAGEDIARAFRVFARDRLN
jgi:haloalkane dehalogenase